MSPNCEYTKTDLGQADARCVGCKWKEQKMEQTKQEQDGSLINEGTKSKQEQGEPVAIVCNKGPKFHHVAILTDSGKQLEDGAKLYTTPQQRKPLTDEQIVSIAYDCNALPEVITDETLLIFARALWVIYGIKE
jgi:hypothetical protein